MKTITKKLGDVTLREIQNICDARETCHDCPLKRLKHFTWGCAFGPFKPKERDDLNDEITLEVKE